jgi:hypothetical protein
MARESSFRRGVIIGPLVAPEEGASTAAFERAQLSKLEQAVALGASHVQLVVRWHQADPRATEVIPYDSVHDDGLSWLIAQAHKRKLRVWLTPMVSVGEGGGSLVPKSWDAWWWSYRRVALHYARVAQLRKVEAYSVGFDLDGCDKQEERWRELIQQVRKVYRGELTYAVDRTRVSQVAFWDAVDWATVTVHQSGEGDEDDLASELEPLPRALSALHGSGGYVLVDGGCGSDDARLVLCQRALFEQFRDDAALRGVYMREPSDAPSSGAITRHWYQKSKR